MTLEVRVPPLGESVTEATVARWTKQLGERVQEDEPLVELETDKVTLEVGAPKSGTLTEIRFPAGSVVEVGAVLGVVSEKEEDQPAPSSAVPEALQTAAEASSSSPERIPALGGYPPAPAARKLMDENNLNPAQISGSGKGGRLLKEDVMAYMKAGPSLEKTPEGTQSLVPITGAEEPREVSVSLPEGRQEERVPMTRLRKRIAERLKQAQNTAAMLTTFNEVDMSAVMDIRGRTKDQFEKKHGVKLGFMSFFVKACIVALKEIPAVNAEIDGDDIVFKNYYDISVAVGTPQGLVVPVVRSADKMSFAEIEKTIAVLGQKAREGKLTMADLTGGTFTISNGGIYGSLMSTPILNPPQSGILGMHKIQQRPVVLNDKIEIRPMMYLALSYDHRIVDGREAVTFLVRLKECLEDPQRILLNI